MNKPTIAHAKKRTPKKRVSHTKINTSSVIDSDLLSRRKFLRGR